MILNFETVFFHKWRQSFFVNRPKYMKEYLKKEFDLNGTVENLQINTINDESGTIVVNGKEINLEAGTWSGGYFTDYPITVTASPETGYEFVGWSGDIESTDMTLELNVSRGGIYLEAVFREKD